MEVKLTRNEVFRILELWIKNRIGGNIGTIAFHGEDYDPIPNIVAEIAPLEDYNV